MFVLPVVVLFSSGVVSVMERGGNPMV